MFFTSFQYNTFFTGASALQPMAVTYPGLNYSSNSLMGSGISASQPSSALDKSGATPGGVNMASAAGAASVSSSAPLGYGSMTGGYMSPTGPPPSATASSVMAQAAYGRADSMQTDLQSKAPRPKPSRFVRR